jgi:hypothetical protein
MKADHMRTPAFATVFVTIVAVAAGCAPPLEPRVAAYPAYGQDYEQMDRDSAYCEEWAGWRSGSAADDTVASGAIGTLGGAAVGAALGAIAGAIVGSPDTGAAVGAAVGGASGGIQGVAGGAFAHDQRALAAYSNCMAGRGYAVNGYPPGPPPGWYGDERPTDRDVEERLSRLRRLYREGVIGEREYRERRREILGTL